jgi:hypothetical protein
MMHFTGRACRRALRTQEPAGFRERAQTAAARHTGVEDFPVGVWLRASTYGKDQHVIDGVAGS